MHSRFTRRQFMAGAVAAGAALTVPWYLDTGTAFAFYQSQGLRMFAQPLRGVGPGGIPVAAPDAFAAPVTGVTHFSFNVAQFTDQLHPQLVLLRCGVIIRLCHWEEEHNPRSTSAAFWLCKKEHRFRLHTQIPYHQSISYQSTQAPISPKRGSTRMRSLPMCMVGSMHGPVMGVHLPGLLLMASMVRAFTVQQATSTNSSTLDSNLDRGSITSPTIRVPEWDGTMIMPWT